MADFQNKYLDPVSLNPGSNLQLSTYNGQWDGGNATVAEVSSGDWWNGDNSGNTEGESIDAGDIGPGGRMVLCACTNGFATVVLNHGGNLPTSGRAGLYADTDIPAGAITGNKLVAVTLGVTSVTTAPIGGGDADA